MTNTTQCPNCSAIFVISDEQYTSSKGEVRCGTCMEKFRAVFLPNTDNLQINSNSLDAGHFKKTPEPKSELLRVLSKHAKHNRSRNRTNQADFFDRNSLSSISAEAGNSADSHSFSNATKQKTAPKSSDDVSADLVQDSPKSASQNDSSENKKPTTNTDTTASDTITKQNSAALTLNNSDLLSDDLIDEVDILIDSKLIGKEDKTDQSNPIIDDFNLKKSRSSRFKYGLSSLFMIFLCCSLLSVLVYQLWLKQLLPVPLANPVAVAQKKLSPLANKISEQYGYTFPIRKDLNNLQLVSARTETHPTRASTMLLRVMILNRAKIEQPLPSLELTLTDENGRLVSRRTFAPNDYLYNNATGKLIEVNELKKVSIELLTFPKQAHGYELKMVHL